MRGRQSRTAALFLAVLAFQLTGVSPSALAQVGAYNGNNNVGVGNGNGNGNGNSNGNNNGNSNGNNNGSVNQFGFNGKRNTPSIAAPGLAAAGIESCLGSTSLGGSASGIGVTIASTMTDHGCNIRLFSRTLFATGHPVAATQILCNDPQVADALAVEGVRCYVGVGAERQREAEERAAYQASADRLSGCSGDCGDGGLQAVDDLKVTSDRRDNVRKSPARQRRHSATSRKRGVKTAEVVRSRATLNAADQ